MIILVQLSHTRCRMNSGPAYVYTLSFQNLEALSLTMCSQMLDRVIILYDSAHPHTATLVTTVFQEYGCEVSNHPPYSPDLSPLDYKLLSKLKKPLRGISFKNLSIFGCICGIWCLNKNQLLHGRERMLEHWRACTLCEGDYSEGL